MRISNISVSLDAMLPKNSKQLRREVAKACGISVKEINSIRIVRKSVDARKKQNVHFVLTCELEVPHGAKMHSGKAVQIAPIKNDVSEEAVNYAPDVSRETIKDDRHTISFHLHKLLGTNVSRETFLQLYRSRNAAFTAGQLRQSAATVDVDEEPKHLKQPKHSKHSKQSKKPKKSEQSEHSKQLEQPERPAVSAVERFSSIADRPVVVGAGPAGLFCALYLAHAGLQPLLVERGQSVEQRQQTVAAFNNGGELDPNSNIQFGEGGAGTFSDGKLTTGKSDPRIRTVLEIFAACGAPADILVDAKPHIGTDYLPMVVRNLREQIIEAGGEVLFNTQLVGIKFADCTKSDTNPAHLCETRNIEAAILQNLKTGEKTTVPANALVLAIGHSARDTFEMLHAADMQMERKPFAVGVRIEHLQKDIDRAQYGQSAGHPALPPADYKLNVRTRDGRGVYTFCMCPGGEVVAASSEAGGVCVNGMSNHARDGKNANSALLVDVRPDDFPGEDVLAGMYFQRELEQAAYRLGCDAASKMDAASEQQANIRPKCAYSAPTQTVGSFLHMASAEPSTKAYLTYPRGTVSADLHNCLPSLITDALEEALPELDKKLHGFADPQATMTAVEARSSSPVRILRDKQTLQSVSAGGIYPTGEGAGYAGGITSAAVDGLRVAEAIEHEAAIAKAVQALREGRPVIFPTDTVMGVGVSIAAASSPAVLAQIKGRPQSKPIAWLVSSPDALYTYGEDVPEYARQLALKQWPGALTLIVKASTKVPSQFSSIEGTIGLRMPNSKTALRLIREVGCPLAVTSANLAGEPAPATERDLSGGFLQNAQEYNAYLLTASDCGKLTATPSTVIDCTGSTPVVVRA